MRPAIQLCAKKEISSLFGIFLPNFLTYFFSSNR